MPQLNPEFFISQLFWLCLTFTFLFLFLWRISLPRISSVLEKRENKISEDIALAKNLQAEAEEIQIEIDNQLKKTKIETSDLIKEASLKFQNQTSLELDKIDKNLKIKLEEASDSIDKSKANSLNHINDQIYEITKLTLSKISNIQIETDEIKKIVNDVQKKAVN
jgi:F-type H+-transporting ATPase subunit b